MRRLKRSAPSNGQPGLPAPRTTRPEGMNAKTWALYHACARGDVSKVTALLAKDRRLVNAPYRYRFPIHIALFAGSAEIVELLLDLGADPGQSTYTYDSWDKLLLNARERGFRRIESLLQRAMQKRFGYSADFETLREAIVTRDTGK